jgi:hypothetical protein
MIVAFGNETGQTDTPSHGKNYTFAFSLFGARLGWRLPSLATGQALAQFLEPWRSTASNTA